MYITLQVFVCTVHYRCLDVQYTTGVWMYSTLQVFGCTVHYRCLYVQTLQVFGFAYTYIRTYSNRCWYTLMHAHDDSLGLQGQHMVIV